MLVEFVEALGLVGGLSERLKEAGVAENKHVTNLLTDSSCQAQKSYEGSHDGGKVDERVRNIGVEVCQRRGSHAGLDEAEHLVGQVGRRKPADIVC